MFIKYCEQNAVRIMRALFEINLRSNNALLAGKLHQMALMLEHQQWQWQSPLRQFTILTHDIIEKIEKRDLSVQAIREMDAKEIGIYNLKKKIYVLPSYFLVFRIQIIDSFT